jgi:hypothetical protein
MKEHLYWIKKGSDLSHLAQLQMIYKLRNATTEVGSCCEWAEDKGAQVAHRHRTEYKTRSFIPDRHDVF